jgi:hypothetical protein
MALSKIDFNDVHHLYIYIYIMMVMIIRISNIQTIMEKNKEYKKKTTKHEDRCKEIKNKQSLNFISPVFFHPCRTNRMTPTKMIKERKSRVVVYIRISVCLVCLFLSLSFSVSVSVSFCLYIYIFFINIPR